ncbi:MAG: helix-turn-helix transcriptional regulator [Acidiferrobacteraceae bacterium]
MEKLLTIGDLAELLQVSRRTLYNRRQRAPGSLPPVVCLPGSHMLRWRAADVEHWLETVLPVRGRPRSAR